MLTVLIPCYNEANTLADLIQRVYAVELPMQRQVIVIDDGSTDGSASRLDELAHTYPFGIIRHRQNRGKGAAIRSAIPNIQGDWTLIQDADLEYAPADHPRILTPALDGRADIVYGIRSFDAAAAGYWTHRTFNRLISHYSSRLTGLLLADVLTCFKLFRSDLLAQTPLTAEGFDIELELTYRITRHHRHRFAEVPISYAPRRYASGKKIGFPDAVRLLTLSTQYAIRGA